MSFLEQLARGALSQLGGQSGGDMASVAMKLLSSPDVGGLNGLLQMFRDKGLGEAAASWVGTGKNLPVSADQILSVLGQTRAKALAGEAGVPVQDLAGGLAAMLPQLVDRVTPDGRVPAEGDLSQALSQIAGSLFKR